MRGGMYLGENREFDIWLAGIQKLSAKKKKMLIKRLKTAENVYYIEEIQLQELPFLTDRERRVLQEAKRESDPSKVAEEMKEKGVRCVLWSDEDYPVQLLELTDYPYALFVKGSLPDPLSKKAAIVGSRRCTPYGEKYAVEYGKALAECKVEIISGLARGIDGMGQRGALMGRGRTFAVLGSGPDVCYPREHIGLYMDILEQGGGILSEYPPGTPPLPQHFPARNRILSGLSEAVLVMEAGEKSGSLITVDMALEQGKDIYALPGPVNSVLSYGCNRLIQQGAGILLSPENLLEEWSLTRYGIQEKPDKNKKALACMEKLVYDSLSLFPKNLEQLSQETHMKAQEVMRLLVSLELQGYIREVSKNYYIQATESF